MSSHLKLLFSGLVAVIVLAIAFVLVLRFRSAEPVAIPETPFAIPAQTLPAAQELAPAVDTTNESLNLLPQPSPFSVQPSVSAPAPRSATESESGFEATGRIVDIPLGATEQLTRSALGQTARLIAERFGTFSSQNEFQNLRDLQPFMTASLSTWLDGYIAQLEKARSTTTYNSTATVALRATVKEFEADAGHATVAVDTSRTEVVGGKKTTAPHGFEVKFLHEQAAWKIDNVRWVR